MHLSSLRLGPGSSSIIVNGNSGTSRSIQSGTGPDGKPYYVESENVVIGERLFHTDRIYNYTTKNLEERKYSLNLSDPNAKPVTLTPWGWREGEVKEEEEEFEEELWRSPRVYIMLWHRRAFGIFAYFYHCSLSVLRVFNCKLKHRSILFLYAFWEKWEFLSCLYFKVSEKWERSFL